MKASVLESPLGPLLAFTDERGRLCRLDLPRGRTAERMLTDAGDPARDDRAGVHVARAMERYFGGHRGPFDLDFTPEGTPFQVLVWRMLSKVPYGETWSYGQLARRARRTGASRAVGGAVGANPIAIVIPCHRIIGSDGTLTGFGGGLDAKRFLLGLEGALPETTGSLF